MNSDLAIWAGCVLLVFVLGGVSRGYTKFLDNRLEIARIQAGEHCE